jgi:sulfur-oxidizing protein SoxZ
MANVKIRVRVPVKVKKGTVVEVKTLISHKMETGLRKDNKGNKIPRDIVNKFVATYNGKQVFASDWHPALSANPFLSFFLKPMESGMLEMSWTDDKGTVYKQSKKIEVN